MLSVASDWSLTSDLRSRSGNLILARAGGRRIRPSYGIRTGAAHNREADWKMCLIISKTGLILLDEAMALGAVDRTSLNVDVGESAKATLKKIHRTKIVQP